jgi:hypothetical protein
LDILAQADDMISSIAKLVPPLAPLIRWQACEKIKIGPGSLNDVLALTQSAHEGFAQVLTYLQSHKVLNHQPEEQMNENQ